MKKIIKLIKSDSTFLLIIIHVITTLALIIFVSLKYDWIVEQFGSYALMLFLLELALLLADLLLAVFTL